VHHRKSDVSDLRSFYFPGNREHPTSGRAAPHPGHEVRLGTRKWQRLYRLNNPMISAFASVLKCRLKPTTAEEVSDLTSSLSAFTANTVNR
jgi:hypothetical protein